MKFSNPLKLLSFIAAITFVAGVSNAAPPMPECGKPSDELEVCLQNWALPDGRSGNNLGLHYNTGEKYSFAVKTIEHASEPGIVWYYGTGIVRGEYRTYAVKRDFRTSSSLPTTTFPAALYQYNGSAYVVVPGTKTFYMTAKAN